MTNSEPITRLYSSAAALKELASLMPEENEGLRALLSLLATDIESCLAAIDAPLTKDS